MPCGAPRVTPIEIAGALTGLWCVALLWRGSVWNWPVGLINNALFFVLFWGAGLYADASLQVVFFLFGVWGWWNWLRGTTTPDAAPTRAPTAHLIALIPASLIGTAALSLIAVACGGDSESGGGSGSTDANLSGTVFATGSSTVEPITALAGESFNADNPGVNITVEGPGSMETSCSCGPRTSTTTTSLTRSGSPWSRGASCPRPARPRAARGRGT